MELTCWGVRGSIPTPSVKGACTDEYGGNTSCYEVRTTAGELYILDAGSGLRVLGNKLLGEGYGKGQGHARVLITHYHWDHIQGWPFFVPAFIKGNDFRLFGEAKGVDQTGRRPVQLNLEKVLSNQQAYPNFPVQLEQMPAKIECLQSSEGEELQNGITVAYTSLNHPDGVFAYKLQDPAGTLVYTGDTEHDGIHDGPRNQRRYGHSDQRLIRFASGAHTLLADAQYTPEEFEPSAFGKPGMSKKGWGHSTYVSAINVAVEAGVHRLILTHHDPGHDDRKMNEIADRAKIYAAEELAAKGLPEGALEVVVAKEGMKVAIGEPVRGAVLPAA